MEEERDDCSWELGVEEGKLRRRITSNYEVGMKGGGAIHVGVRCGETVERIQESYIAPNIGSDREAITTPVRYFDHSCNAMRSNNA